MRLVFLGPPGAGKGTQAVEIAAKLGIPHLSTGDLLRAEVKGGSDLGVRAKTFMDRGALVPDDLVVEMVSRRIADLEGYLLDGFPRTRIQAEALEARGGPRSVERVFYFDLADEIIIERLGGRRTCSACGAVYHVTTLPPATEGVCDRCGGAVIRRDDDRPETIRRRIAVSKAESEPVLGFYEERGICIRIDASLAPEDVRAEILSHLST